MRRNLIISSESKDTVDLLRSGLAGCEDVTVLKLKPDQLLKLEGLDAFYISVSGAERWGAQPIIRKAQVLRTAPQDEEEGYPSYVIAGGLFDLEDPTDPGFQLRVIMNSVLDAVESFNVDNNEAIKKIAFWTEWLGIERMNAKEGGEIIKSVYEEHYPAASG
jgi:hypothetical protein